MELSTSTVTGAAAAGDVGPIVGSDRRMTHTSVRRARLWHQSDHHAGRKEPRTTDVRVSIPLHGQILGEVARD